MPVTRRKLLLAAPAVAALTACAADLSRHRERPLAELAADLGICAAAYATLTGGEPSAGTALSGCANSSPAPADAVFQAASLTKPVVAFGALRLALAGELDLRSAVSRYLPRGHVHFHSVLARAATDSNDLVPAQALSGVTVAMLLNHTAGLPNWAGGTLSFESEPGERWGYSGEGYMLLQAVLEAVTGTNLADYFDAQVFAPLGMRDTSLVWKDGFAGRAVQGTSGWLSPAPARFRFPVAAASLYTTAADYARFMAALVRDERLMALTLDSPVPVDRELGLEWAQGWGVERTDGGPFLWQWGNNPGFRAFAMFSPSSGDGFVILTDNERGLPLAVPLAHRTLPGTHNAFRFSWVA